jgi:hypothetical protein
MNRLRFYSVFLLGSPLLAGCGADDHSPTVDLLGSYFPAWMICIVIGLTLTVITRQLLVGFKLDAHLRWPALVYPCLMISFTLAVWLLFFQN